MMQGDSYSLAVEILKADGTLLTDADVSNVEITIGHLRKTMEEGSVVFSSGDGVWKFPLSQEETFRYLPSRVRGQVRVFWKNGEVEGIKLDDIIVLESISKEVL